MKETAGNLRMVFTHRSHLLLIHHPAQKFELSINWITFQKLKQPVSTTCDLLLKSCTLECLPVTPYRP